MSKDWRSDYDKRLEEQRQRERQEEQRKWEAERQAELARIKEKKQREEEEKRRDMAEWGRRYKCHICGKRSQSKYERKKTVGQTRYNPQGGLSSQASYVGTGEYYPGDLHKCDNCGKWTCNEHIHQGRCKKCIEGKTGAIDELLGVLGNRD
jgi:hypothetical protein